MGPSSQAPDRLDGRRVRVQDPAVMERVNVVAGSGEIDVETYAGSAEIGSPNLTFAGLLNSFRFKGEFDILYT